MKCPKCDYLGFETGDRCKNCGYDFSLLAAPQTEPADLNLKPPVRDDVAIGDLWLGSSASGADPSADAVPSIESFPLRSPSGDDDQPLITLPSEPRPPLSVRRTPDTSRSRTAPKGARVIDTRLALEFADEVPDEPSSSVGSAEIVPAVRPAYSFAAIGTASIGRRTLAALVDHAILSGIDVLVFFSTLRMTGLTMEEWRALPALPLLAFLLLLKLGYFSAFTALGGQTIGKMAAGIRVVADDDLNMDPARAITRALTSAVSVGSLGLGLIPALVDPDRRALHDRVAHTHVVDLPSA